jgi:hypothetical protein
MRKKLLKLEQDNEIIRVCETGHSFNIKDLNFLPPSYITTDEQDLKDLEDRIPERANAYLIGKIHTNCDTRNRPVYSVTFHELPKTVYERG